MNRGMTNDFDELEEVDGPGGRLVRYQCSWCVGGVDEGVCKWGGELLIVL
jgi:hypothetical protein